MDNLLDQDGAYFRCLIEGKECEGVITVEKGKVYLCQNIMFGSSCIDKKGYRSSWTVRDGNEMDLAANSVTNFIILRPFIKQDMKELIRAECDKMSKEMTIPDDMKDIFINAFELGADYGYKLKK